MTPCDRRVNPFHVIYDAVSDGLHSKSDEECCAIVDKLDGALTFVYRELKPSVPLYTSVFAQPYQTASGGGSAEVVWKRAR